MARGVKRNLAIAAPAGAVEGAVVEGLQTGRLVVRDGEVRVSIGGGGPLPARFTRRLDRQALAKLDGAEVLVLVEKDRRPLVVDLVDSEPPSGIEAIVDGRRVVIEGHESVLIKCGDSAIELRADGKVVIRGKEVVSRASGTNRIRGGAVKIN